HPAMYSRPAAHGGSDRATLRDTPGHAYPRSGHAHHAPAPAAPDRPRPRPGFRSGTAPGCTRETARGTPGYPIVTRAGAGCGPHPAPPGGGPVPRARIRAGPRSQLLSMLRARSPRAAPGETYVDP